MNKLMILVVMLWSTYSIAQSTTQQDSIQLRTIYTTALTAGQSYAYVDHLSNQIGSRLSGSLQEKKTIQWATQTLKSIGLTTRKQAVTVPKWTRGVTEFAYIESQAGTTTNVSICALIGSVATPVGGMKAEVVTVTSLEGLRTLGSAAITDKIVFFNTPIAAKHVDPFDGYSAIAAIYRDGAKEAAKFGAIGVIIRSANTVVDDHPHTAVVQYGTTTQEDKIPVAAISTHGADLLHGMLNLDKKTRFFFNMNCKNWKPTPSFNVIGEWKGSEVPNTYITIAGTIDSWDMGDGAQSNNAALAQAIETIRILKTTGYTPKHSIRVVLLADGIQSQQGRKVYERSLTAKNETQYLFLHNDTGGFTPQGFSMNKSDAFVKQLQESWSNFEPYMLQKIISKPIEKTIFNTQFPVVTLKTDPQRYFAICRSSLDTFRTINEREVALGAAAMTSLLYLVDQQ